jgi:hypothetical protein
MSLLREIQSECVAKDASISRLLRQCLVLAARLDNRSLREWAESELNGYAEGSSLPSYRVFAVRSRGYFVDRHIGSGTLDIPVTVLPEDLRKEYAEARLDQPIGQYEDLVRRSEGDKEGLLRLPWPIGLAVKYGSKISSMQCVEAWRELPVAAVVGMIDTVKTRILTLSLDLERADSRAGEVSSTSLNVTSERVAQIIVTNIYGGQVGNIATASPATTQTYKVQVVKGDLGSLLEHLRRLGFDEASLKELPAVIDADAKEGTQGLGSRTKAWLSKAATRIGSFATDVSKETLTSLATKAILAFLGLE